MKVRLSPEAQRQGEEAEAWWRANRPLAPSLFAGELNAALERIAQSPAIGVPRAHRRVPGVRRLLLLETRYHLYYVLDPARDEVRVLSVWSAVRGRGPKLGRP